MNIREVKKPIRAFMQTHYTDERLAQLLCHTRDGKLSYWSCCCFIGIANSNHALQVNLFETEKAGVETGHYLLSRKLQGAHEAESAYNMVGLFDADSDGTRRRILIPMIRAEMKRRGKRSIEVQPQSIEESAVLLNAPSGRD